VVWWQERQLAGMTTKQDERAMMSDPRMIARSVSNGLSAKAAAVDFLAQHHPEFVGCDLAELKFEWGWLVETVTADREAEKIVLLVNRHGFVEEVGADVRFRQTAQRSLIDLRTNSAQPVPQKSWS
jgi:hypothetical protein